ncbi:MAG TPA: PDZ domain-containing protein [bacterium]|nr:PDZ domain-containing protein [bacterium]
MSRIDLNEIEFDFDLTFAALVMHPDGTVYHRYGGRGPDEPNGYLSLESLCRLLRDSIPEHRAHEARAHRRKKRKVLHAIDLPVLRRKRARGQQIDCVHCHTINDARHVQAQLDGSWRRDDVFAYPDPERIGLSLDHERQHIVRKVKKGSPAAKAGIKAGDELLAVGEQQSVRTLSDVQWALHRAPFARNRLAVRIRSEGRERSLVLRLKSGWKRCPPERFAWRPTKWNLTPSPGFGGPTLQSGAAPAGNGQPQAFRMRVDYIVDWGENAHRGRAARAAGLKIGDIVVGFAGKRDFESFDHLHAWVGLTLKAGQAVTIDVLRGGKPLTLRYRLPK